MHYFLNMANCNLSETGRNKVELVLNILAYSNIKHIQKLSRDIQTHSEACVALLYLEALHIQNPWYIQNPGIFRIRAISRTLIYSGPPWILTTLSSICDNVFYENNANSFLLYFQIWQVATLVVPVAIRLN